MMKSIKQREQMEGYMRDTNFFIKKPRSCWTNFLNFFSCAYSRK